MNLYELTERYQNLLPLLNDPAIDEEIIQQALAEVGGDIAEKAEGYARVRQMLLAESAAVKAEEERLNKLRKTKEKSAERLLNWMGVAMKSIDAKEIKTPIGSWKFAKNPPSVITIDESLIPQDYWKQAAPTLDKAAILETLKAGKVVPGAALSQSESLRFK